MYIDQKIRHKKKMVIGIRNALLCYTIFFLALTFPYWLMGEVISPHRQFDELAIFNTSTPVGHLENKKFSDYTNGFYPLTNEFLNGHRSGWLTLWTNSNELGKPLHQTFGFSPAYTFAYIFALITNNPAVFITFFSLSTCFFAGLFMMLLFRELELSPLAGLLAAGSLASSPQFIYWLTFPFFIAAWCWSAGALYALSRLHKKPDLLGWLILAFSIYSLLMAAYPQLVVFHVYVLCGYGCFLIYRRFQIAEWASVFRWAVFVASSVAVGGLLSLPTYLDLMWEASESVRGAADLQFFSIVVPKFDSLDAVLRFLSISSFPSIFGNPIASTYPISIYDGQNLTVLVIFLTLIGIILCLQKTWGWWLSIIFFCAFSFSFPLYAFAYGHLGFHFSRSTPLGAITLPLTIVTAYGVDELIRRLKVGQHSWAVMLATLGTIFGLLIAVGFGLTHGLNIRWGEVVMTLVVVGFLAAQLNRTRPNLLIAALVMVGGYISFPLMLRQDPTQIATTSPLVKAMRANLPSGSRFAVAAPGLLVLPPNLNAGLGLASVHSYNSLDQSAITL